MTARLKRRRGDPAPATPVAEEGLQRHGWSTVATAMTVGAIVAWVLVASWWHLTQGIADVGAAAVWHVITGAGQGQDAAVVVASRLPRLVAALLVGGVLGASGAAMQAVARNPLASPDTTAVNAGAFLAMTAVTAFGISTGALTGTAVAFLGGIAAATVVITLSSGPDASAIRLVLAGSVLTLGLSAITSVLLLLLPWETQGLFAWGAGSLSQNSLHGVRQVAPVAAIAVAGLMAMARRLDLLQLGDDAARALGIGVFRTRLLTVILAVLLAACAVSLAGPIGFVGLCAPVIVRLQARWIPPLRRHRVLVPASMLAGAALLLTSDVVLRALFTAEAGVGIPAGVVTTVIGAVVLIAVAQTMRVSMTGDSLATLRGGIRRGRTHPAGFIGGALLVLLCAVIAATLLGDRMLLLGDVWNWLTQTSSIHIEITLDRRVPRVAAAVLAGVCLALAGGVVQNVTRNPLADPSILGFTNAAGLGAVTVIVTTATPGFVHLLAGGVGGVILAAAIVFGLSARDGMNPVRMVLVGVATGAGASAIITLLIVRTDPWNQTKAMTWLGGSTYGMDFSHVMPMLGVLAVAAVMLVGTGSDLDVMQIDDLTPRMLGVRVGRSRTLHLALALGLTAAATVSVGVIAFVGLVAPHAARILVGKQHRTMLPLAAVLGALLVTVADVVGRVVIAPGKLPVGLVTALIGTPYFLWLLWWLRGGR